MTQKFDMTKISIGNAAWHYKYTKWIAKYFPEIDDNAELHDEHWMNLYREISWTNRIFLKIIYDLIFLIFGTIRITLNIHQDIPIGKQTFKKLKLFIPRFLLRIIAIIINTQLYIILLLTTPFPKLWFKK